MTNVKISGKKTLPNLRSQVDAVTQVRGSFFNEMHSYATLPLTPGNVALAIATSMYATTTTTLKILFIRIIYRILFSQRTIRHRKIV